MALAGALAMLPASAGAVTIQTIGFGLASSGAGIPTHQNHFNRDGFPSSCDDTVEPPFMVPTQTTTPATFGYKTSKFNSHIQEAACVTVSVSTACTGTDAIMSETYGPAYNPASITSNWLGDLGDNPPAATSYGFVAAAGADFETVVERETSSGSCGGITVTWSSDRPWANAAPHIGGIAAVGLELKPDLDIWAGDPLVSHQWLRCDDAGANCAEIPGATSVTYVPVDADIGHTIALRQRATADGFTSTSELSFRTRRVFIPAVTHDGGLGAGDQSMAGKLNVVAPASSCEVPKAVPAQAPTFNEFFLFETVPVHSLINEPTCMTVTRGFACFGNQTTVYSPSFSPQAITENYVADDNRGGTLNYPLAPGQVSTVVVSTWDQSFPCPQYTMLVGSMAPFATVSPALGGPAVEGTPETTTNGEWGGAPSFQQSWLRCDADGNACEAIAGAGGASYTPAAADVGHRLRSRITATQVNTSTADSAPSAVIGPDATPPHGTLALGRTNLTKVVKRGFIPVTATCDESCTVKVSAVVSKKAAKRLGTNRKVASGKGTARPGKRSKLRVKLTRRARRALRGKRLVRFQLVATFTDARGNASGVRRKAALKRKR
jgi:hypothetical protein